MDSELIILTFAGFIAGCLLGGAVTALYQERQRSKYVKRCDWLQSENAMLKRTQMNIEDVLRARSMDKIGYTVPPPPVSNRISYNGVTPKQDQNWLRRAKLRRVK